MQHERAEFGINCAFPLDVTDALKEMILLHHHLNIWPLVHTHSGKDMTADTILFDSLFTSTFIIGVTKTRNS